MRRARAIGTRLPQILARVFLDALLPLAVAYLVVSFLADPAHIDTSELRANSLLMNTRQIFREESNPFAAAIGSSAILLAAAMAGAVLLGVPAGIAYGWSGNRVLKGLAWSASTLAASLPAFFWAVAIELVMVLIWVQMGIRFLPTAGFGIDDHLVLPALALGIRPAAYIFRLTATAVEEIRHTDYVRTAIAKGLGARQILPRHVLPNAAPNIIAATVLGARGALSSLVLIEYVFIWGGAGLLFVQALGNRRLELATELALSFAVGSALLALAAELARARVRVES
ncbi:MAG TPA: ABC transporter permease [Methylomirabilota bacterium]|jgi:ABC-type dipeptide/oligopeptide/nickel transport system permease component|nr:ABC transporter permease [Methylomirabilota bacterium]